AGAGRAQHQLRIGRGAELVDAEDVYSGVAALQRDPLVVPERRHRGDAAGDQVRDGVIADHDLLDRGRVTAGTGDDRTQYGGVARNPRDAHRPALQLPWVVDLGCGDHRCQRTLDDRHDRLDRLAALAGDCQIVQVED